MYKEKYKRIFDFNLAFLIFILTIPILCLIVFILFFQSGFPVIHWSKRVGKKNIIFNMPKFRTMKIDTPQIATHLIKDPDQYLTKFGKFLRKTSLDELPQLLSIIKGNMSFVGPRPALYNQYDLINLRKRKNIDQLMPGLTGWAQINGRDELSIKDKVQFDYYYFKNISLFFDLIIMFKSINVLYKVKDVKH